MTAEHLDKHAALAERLWRGDPPELWDAAQRLLDLGMGRHDVMHALMHAIESPARTRAGCPDHAQRAAAGAAGLSEPPAIDLNADLGESFGAWTLGDDAALMGLITSANVACGFHAGDPLTLRRACATAAAREVTIGAQVSPTGTWPGSGGARWTSARRARAEIFTRSRRWTASPGRGRARPYVKPHGALYHRVIRDPLQAEALVSAMRAYDPSLILLTRPDGRAAEIAGASGTPVVSEAYADRAYRPDGSLVPRGEAGAVLTDPGQVSERAVGIVTAGTVLAADGTAVRVQAHSLCIHGDTQGASTLARAVRRALEQAGVLLAPFA